MYVCMYVCIYLSIYASMYLCICVSMYVYMYAGGMIQKLSLEVVSSIYSIITWELPMVGSKRQIKLWVWSFVSTIFYQFFIFSPNDSPSKTINNAFYFIKKALFSPRYSFFCNFFPSFPHSSNLERQIEVEQFMMSWIVLHKFRDVIFRITQKLLYIRS